MAVHFPLPYAEIAADIVTGRIDAVEMQALTPGIDGPSIREWYRYLNCGYRLPIVGGTDKMSAEIPLGAIRTYARLDPGLSLSFEAWAAAVRGVDLRLVGRLRGPPVTGTGRVMRSTWAPSAGRSRCAWRRRPPGPSSTPSS